MTGHVQKTLIALGLGTVVQRGALLAVTVALGNALGPAGLGRYALALAIGNLLAALVGAGIRSVCSREAVREPERVGGWLRTAIRLRAALTVAALAPTLWTIVAFADQPLPLALGALLALPLAWDQKNLLDAAARASREVTFELGVAGFHLVATLALLVVGVRDLATLVAVQLVARLAYAIAASATVRELPGYRHPPSARAVLRLAALPSFTQTAAATIQNGDVWLVHWFGGEAAAGLYTVAQRLASTATLPGAQLLRLLQPHTDRAAHAGDPSATAARALRTTGYAVVPIAAGGMVVAEPLCRLFGAEFAAGGDALLLMLPAFTALQFAWQLAQILFAHGWVGRWAGAQWLGAVAQAVAIAWLVPRWGATGAAAAALLGNALFLVVARLALGHRLGVSMLRTVAPSLLPAIATAAAALAALPLGLVAQLAAGGVAYTATIYALELRSNWRRLGSGLQGASGFGSTR